MKKKSINEKIDFNFLKRYAYYKALMNIIQFHNGASWLDLSSDFLRLLNESTSERNQDKNRFNKVGHLGLIASFKNPESFYNIDLDLLSKKHKLFKHTGENIYKKDLSENYRKGWLGIPYSITEISFEHTLAEIFWHPIDKKTKGVRQNDYFILRSEEEGPDCEKRIKEETYYGNEEIIFGKEDKKYDAIQILYNFYDTIKPYGETNDSFRNIHFKVTFPYESVDELAIITINKDSNDVMLQTKFPIRLDEAYRTTIAESTACLIKSIDDICRELNIGYWVGMR